MYSTNQPQLKHMQCVHKEEIQLPSIFLCMSFYYMEYTVAIFAVIYKQSTYVAASYNQCFTLQKTTAINDLILPFGFVAIFWYMIT